MERGREAGSCSPQGRRIGVSVATMQRWRRQPAASGAAAAAIRRQRPSSLRPQPRLNFTDLCLGFGCDLLFGFCFFKRSSGAFRAPSIISVALSLTHSPPPPPTLLFLSSRRSRSPQMIREQVTCGEHFSPRTEESGDGHGGDVRPA